MFIRSEIYAKPGELMQGELPGNKRFLLSNKSSAILKNSTEIEADGLPVRQKLNSKSQKAIELFWASMSVKKNRIDISKLTIKQYGNIPVAKGLASSSADVLGILTALNRFYMTNYAVEKLYTLAAAIEPTDPCLHTGNVLFRQHTGEVTHTLTSLPYRLIYFDSDEQAQVNTIALSEKTSYSESQQQEYENLCNRVTQAIAHTDYNAFNFCISRSAEINQSLLPKKNFSALQDFAAANKVGLFVAHSGTYMGFVVEPARFETVRHKAIALITKNWNTFIYTE